MAVAVGLPIWLYYRQPPGSRSLAGTNTGKVSRILTYPVKSCRPVEMVSCMCLKRGLEYDRRWIIVDMESSVKPKGAAGVGITMLNYPKMTQIQPQISLAAPSIPGAAPEIILTLCAEGMLDLQLSTTQMMSNKTDVIHCLRISCEAYDCGDAAAEWLSTFLNKPTLRLYFMASSQKGRIVTEDQKWGSCGKSGDSVSFASVSPYLICSEQSLADISSRMKCTIDMERFRPNIVVDCPGMKPYAEDSWQRFSLGNMEFWLMKKCGRCPIIMQDPATGKTDAHELLPKLREFRLDSSDERHGNAPIFGIQVAAEHEGLLSVKDAVKIIEIK